MIRIVTDSVSDLPDAEALRLGIDVVPMLVEIDGASYRDGVDLSREQFYAQLVSGHVFPRTAVPGMGAFIAAYRALAEQGASDILSIHLSKRYSSVVDAAIAAAQVAQQEPWCRGTRIHVLDSGSIEIGLGWMAIEAAEMAAQGGGVQAIMDELVRLRRRIHIYAMADTLKYLRKGGRVNALVGGIGELLQIRLLVEINDGTVSQMDRARTRSRGIERLIEAAHAQQGVKRLAVLHSGGDITADVAYIQQRVSDLLPLDQQWMMLATPVLGAHFGPLGLGIALLTDV